VILCFTLVFYLKDKEGFYQQLKRFPRKSSFMRFAALSQKK
tara:strand:- start:6103 stop:6225 length:123 start_codon:yes stop_codon:yes gene_type:complete